MLVLAEAILILQPTWTAGEKVIGARAHASLNLLSFVIFTAGVLIIEANKSKQTQQSRSSPLGQYGIRGLGAVVSCGTGLRNQTTCPPPPPPHIYYPTPCFSSARLGRLFTDTPTVKQGPDSHFHSVHGYLGVLTSVVLLVQYIFGFLMWGVPGVFGGIDNAKALWKYHRISGYLLFILILATVTSAVWTDFNVNVLKIRLWAVIVAIALIVLGVYPRLHPRKLGFNIGRH